MFPRLLSSKSIICIRIQLQYRGMSYHYKAEIRIQQGIGAKKITDTQSVNDLLLVQFSAVNELSVLTWPSPYLLELITQTVICPHCPTAASLLSNPFCTPHPPLFLRELMRHVVLFVCRQSSRGVAKKIHSAVILART